MVRVECVAPHFSCRHKFQREWEESRCAGRNTFDGPADFTRRQSMEIETMLNFIRTTKTDSRLTVTAYLIPQKYDTGIKISDEQMRQLKLVKYDTLGLWNCTLRPAPHVN